MDEITIGMAPLFQKARAHGLWFYCAYQQLWFSPDNLEREQKNGRFRWGAVNWELRDPREQVTKLRDEAKGLLKRAEALEYEIAPPREATMLRRGRYSD